MSKWDPRTIIVFMLAAAVSIAHIVAIGGLAWHGRSLTEVGGEVMIALLGAIIAIIAAYIGKNGSGPSTGG